MTSLVLHHTGDLPPADQFAREAMEPGKALVWAEWQFINSGYDHSMRTILFFRLKPSHDREGMPYDPRRGPG